MIEVRAFNLPPIDVREVERYMGVRGENEAVRELIASVAAEVQPQICGRVCFEQMGISIDGETVSLGFAEVKSRSLAEQLADCREAVLLGATVGLGIDRLISKYSTVTPSRAHCIQCMGAERIECLCDCFEDTLKNGRVSRFSAGYGDLPLEFQREIFAYLDLPRRIGLTLNDSLIMSPSKSVTAIVGIKE